MPSQKELLLATVAPGGQFPENRAWHFEAWLQKSASETSTDADF
jgi:hypothetical protein